MQEFIIVFRETLEAALIIGIVATFLVKLNEKKGLKMVWRGIAAAIACSLLFGWLLITIEDALKTSAYEKLFEGLMMYLASGFLIYMIIWMTKNVNIKKNLEEKAASSIEKASYSGIFLLVFFAVLREGFETAIFLFGASNISDFSYTGFFTGMVAAITIGYLIFIQGKRVSLRKFFNVTSVLLILFAGGMAAYGTHEMEEFFVKTGALDEEKITRVWRIVQPLDELPASGSGLYEFNEGKEKYYHMFHDKGSVGSFLKGFFGYNSDPNPIELLLWFLTVGGTFFFWNKARKSRTV